MRAPTRADVVTRLAAALVAVFMIAAAAGTNAEDCTRSDTFDSGLTDLWEVSHPTIVTVTPEGHLQIGFKGDDPQTLQSAVFTPCVYTDFEASFRCRDLSGSGGKAFEFRIHDDLSVGYGVNLRSTLDDVLITRGDVDGPPDIVARASLPHDTGQWMDVWVSMVGSTITVRVDGVQVLQHTDWNPLPAGAVMFAINSGGNGVAHAQFDDFVIDAFDAIPVESQSWTAIKARS